MQPVEALRSIAFLLERSLAPSYRVEAFRRAALILDAEGPERVQALITQGRLQALPGIGKATEQVVLEAVQGQIPQYLLQLQQDQEALPDLGADLRAALKGDCHTHSTWSDGGSSILEMARTARMLGREYIVMTDHSPRLTIAKGLSVEELQAQFLEIETVNKTLAQEAKQGHPAFKVLRGIEVDILDDGALDQTDEMLDQLDCVVGSVHSKLRMDKDLMTARMLAAIENPRLNVLGHCTGRLVGNKKRPQSAFDADAVFRACKEHDVAVEINSRPERKDPPIDLLQLAADIGCKFTIDTDAHAPGQLDWLWIGCERAARCGIKADRIRNTKDATGLMIWAKAN